MLALAIRIGDEMANKIVAKLIEGAEHLKEGIITPSINHNYTIVSLHSVAIARQESNAFFHFINTLHERTSFIITTNKSPKEWAETIGNEVITTALLDWLLYRCEIIKLSGES